MVENRLLRNDEKWERIAPLLPGERRTEVVRPLATVLSLRRPYGSLEQDVPGVTSRSILVTGTTSTSGFRIRRIEPVTTILHGGSPPLFFL